MPVISFKVTAEEARLIRAKARAERAPTLSAFLREKALGPEALEVRVVRKLHPVSKLPYNAVEERVVTQQEIEAALAEFP